MNREEPGMQSIARDNRVLQASNGVQKFPEAGDSVGLEADLDLSQNGTGTMVYASHEVDPVTATVLRPRPSFPSTAMTLHARGP
jgi:hypothetical protein